MDRPITLMEALARANGLDTGIIEEKTVELADLAHSILMRNGQRVPVDFEKLFWKGDMSQNIEIEPNDYLHIASAGSNDVYVFGEVQRPGRQGFIGDLTVLGAIALRGGYSKAAYRDRVLVVRGSLAHPQLFAINTNDVLKGRTANFRLQPKDIVYVNARPWQAAEMLVDLAVTTFFQGAASAWANRDIPMLITAPLLPQTATGRERTSQLR
jgi:protein involved in polysaccharide export with SLBB domain